jgi:hypothetical protein
MALSRPIIFIEMPLVALNGSDAYAVFIDKQINSGWVSQQAHKTGSK